MRQSQLELPYRAGGCKGLAKDTWSRVPLQRGTDAEFGDNCPNTAVVEMVEALHSFLKNSPIHTQLKLPDTGLRFKVWERSCF
jgi:hypothetical protein